MGLGPYREGSGAEETSVTDDAGIVGELIEQFADPLAFYRELIQNAIDAGTDSIGVSLVWEGPGESGEKGEPGSGMTHVSVRDEGEGMDRDVLENQLLVLFRSGKEGQEGKIGKFGVGFVSVLAVKPSVVVVHTSKGGGRAWALHLHPDQSYDLFELEGGEASGTTVTLRVPMGRDEFEDFAKRSEKALHRWCRHARVPIRFSAQRSGAADPLRDARVDRDLDLSAIVSVERTYDGIGRLVVGLRPPGKPYSAFFNQGLLLWETIGPLIHPSPSRSRTAASSTPSAATMSVATPPSNAPSRPCARPPESSSRPPPSRPSGTPPAVAAMGTTSRSPHPSWRPIRSAISAGPSPSSSRSATSGPFARPTSRIGRSTAGCGAS